MLRILGNISIYGSQCDLEKLASTAKIPNSTLRQIGILRKIPDIDSWCYGTQWYRFNFETLDEEIQNFLIAHEQLGIMLPDYDISMDKAVLTLCPVEQSDEEVFSCLLSNDTLHILSRLSLSLQIAPASIMPDVMYWGHVAL